MVTLKEVYDAVDSFYPFALQEPWDNSGVQIGFQAQTVSKIALSVDVTPGIIKECKSNNVDLLISHHPSFFRATASISEATPQGILAGCLTGMLTESRLMHISCHTSADKARYGVADVFIELLGLDQAMPIIPEPHDGTLGIGRIGNLENATTLLQLAHTLKSIIPETSRPLLVAGDARRTVQRVAILPGAGDSEFTAVRRANADVYITSDLRHHPALDQLTLNYTPEVNGDLALIDVPHSAVESVFLRKFELLLEDRVKGVEILNLSDVNTDPWNFAV
ncbi:MAG: Nif3-like dinuclear metal center hexameric protein [Candidatus Ancillula sp.]|jgi:dinuclear metal center YbgI/SA1388 family protein|nr:Nif3-like dinuclear metal center hexameric protein [Candidatus Ancillula sp.]